MIAKESMTSALAKALLRDPWLDHAYGREETSGLVHNPYKLNIRFLVLLALDADKIPYTSTKRGGIY